jgi:hypothetical protein
LEIGFGHLLGAGSFADAAGFGEGFEAEVAALLGPFVVLFGQDGADEANDAVAVGEDADDVGAAADLSVEALVRVIGPDLLPDLFGKAVNARISSRAASRCSKLRGACVRGRPGRGRTGR